jgi:DNA-binding beta-propeller fold protein YncE
MSPDGGNVYAATYSNAVVRLNRNTTTGALTQPAGAAGCISQTGVGPCADGHGLKSPVSVMVSSDGRSVYVASPGGDDVARFNRNTTTGALSQPAGTAGCVSETGAGPCADGHALSSPVDLTGSPDGKSVYVASTPSNAAVRLDRNTTTGALTEPSGTDGCISQTGAGGCVMAPQLSQFGSPILNPGFTSPSSVASSADGKSVYVASDSGGVARLNRNTTTGAVTQPANAAGCILQDAASNGIPCADAHGLRNPASAAVSPDGKNVYVASAGSDGVARLNRNTTTGALTQPAGTGGCTNETGSNDCADGHALRDPTSVAVSADGKSVYLASFLSDAVARFNRTP